MISIGCATSRTVFRIFLVFNRRLFAYSPAVLLWVSITSAHCPETQRPHVTAHPYDRATATAADIAPRESSPPQAVSVRFPQSRNGVAAAPLPSSSRPHA